MRRALARAAPGLARDLPWIAHRDPWAIYVAEVMLQQTSTARVREPWRRFLERFATPSACADAPLADVVTSWRGLGYPRRAKALHDAARIMRDEFAGAVPDTVAQLRRLPGVGPYTASAVASFAFARRVAVLDTNVARVVSRAVANRSLSLAEAREAATALLPARAAARHNQAVMDLGAQFCRARPRCGDCPLARVCRWRREGGADPAPTSGGVSRPQAPFAGSDRELRGRVLAAVGDAPRTPGTLRRLLGAQDPARVDAAVEGLVRDGLVERSRVGVRLAGS